jgi:rhomboid protease GluP
VGINCAVFLAMVVHGVSAGSPTTDQLMQWGADNAGAVLNGGQWWRIVSAMFVHVGILHLATNMWCLWNLSLLAEPLLGSTGVVAAYILTGAAGNLLSTFVNWMSFPDARGSVGGVLFPAGAGSGLRIDNMAHLGGFSSGLLFAAPLVPRLGSPRRLFNVRLRFAVVGLVGLLVLFGFYLAQLPG